MIEVFGRGCILEVDLAYAKTHTQCDNCKVGIQTKKEKKPVKKGEAAPEQDPPIQATLAKTIGSPETGEFHFCDEECLRQFLNKRAGTKK